MTYHKIFSMCAAVAVTFAQFAFVTQPVSAKGRTLVVTAQADVVTRRVSHADLNLATLPGQQTLHRRVRGAVKDLCNEASSGGDSPLASMLERSGCTTTAWAGARPQIDRAVQRASEVAATGTSSIATTAITIAVAD